MTDFGSPEKVYVELEWYDGPRVGVADINGLPYRFKALFDEPADEYLGTFLVFPITDEALALEIEQWRIFVAWNTRYEAGEVTVESHPGHGGINSRWDEIELLLKKSRDEVPVNAKKALAKFEPLNREKRYEECGPDYALRWSIQ